MITGFVKFRVKWTGDTMLFQAPFFSKTIYSIYSPYTFHNKRPILKKILIEKKRGIRVFSLVETDCTEWKIEFQILFPNKKWEPVIQKLEMLRKLYEKRTIMLLSFGI